jgi:hypothetical protein
MWSFQGLFRHAVEFALRRSLEVLGETVEPAVFLIGVLRDGGSGPPLCVEPVDGPIVAADFGNLHDRAAELYEQDPNSQTIFSIPWHHERRHQEFRHRAYGTAISEVLEAKLGPGLRFFVGPSAAVEQYLVFTAVGLPDVVLDDAPQLKSETVPPNYPVTRSLIEGAVDEILRLSRRTLYEPDAGAGLGLGAEPADVARAAGKALTLSATALTGNLMGSDLFDGLNRVATTRYERRVGIGSLLIADAGSEHVDRSVTLRAPVRISETRTLRKLLETSSREGESLLTDGSEVYGLGWLRADYPAASESVFQVLVLGDGVWELRHDSVPLAVVQFGAPRLPEERVRRDRFDDVCVRVFGECDSDALWVLATSAADAEHGTMLVISGSAANEAARLASQALTIDPTRLDDSLVQQFTGIDGAVLVDPSGYCHAIGVILDGTATSEGDRSRGARYNSAVKYLASVADRDTPTPTVILLVSEDGMINILPALRQRTSRAELDAMLDDLRKAAAIEPVHGERFYKAYRRVKAKAFYLSPDQIDEVNDLMDDHWKRRREEGAQMWTVDPKLRPDPEMTDDYFTD